MSTRRKEPKVVAQFVKGVAATGDDRQDKRRVQLWCNRIEEAALRILDEHGGEPTDMVICTRTYFTKLQNTARSS